MNKDGWWSGVQVMGARLDQRRLSEMLRVQAAGLGVARVWEFQPTSDDGFVMWRHLAPITGADLAAGGLASVMDEEFERLARFVPVIDTFFSV